VGAPSRKDLLAEMDTSTELVAEDKPTAAASMDNKTVLLLGVAAAAAAYWIYTSNNKGRR
jgi:hypothetical protein